MPKFEITAPDGQRYEVEGPDEQGAIAALKKQLAAQPSISTGEDVARSAGSGLRTGTEMLTGTMGDLGRLPGRAASKVASWLGADPETVEKIGKFNIPVTPGAQVAAAVKAFGGPDTEQLYAPTTEQVQEVTKPVLGEPHQPQTTLGKYARTGAEFASGAIGGGGTIGRRVAQALVPGLMSEAAGQATEGTDLEPWARVAGGLAYPGLQMGTQMLKRGPPTAAAMTLEQQGIPLSAGQATGNRGLKYAESELGGAPYADLMERQRQAFTSRALEQAGAPPGTLGTPEEMAREYQRIGNQFDQVIASAGDVTVDTGAQQRLMQARDEYNSLTGPNNRSPAVDQTLQDVRSLFTQNGDRPIITGEQYQIMRSRLGEQIRAADPATSTALRNMQDALDDAMEAQFRATNPEMAGAWGEARRQYRNYLDLERSLASGPAEQAAEGLITPTALRTAVRTVEGPRRLVQGRSDFTEMANAGVRTMKPMPESGTSARLATRSVPAVIGGSLGAALGLTGGPVGPLILGPLGAGIGHMAGGRMLMSEPVQRLLRETPRLDRGALAALIAARQGGER